MRILVSALFIAASGLAHAQEDPYLWLEDVMGEKAIAWAKAENAKSQPAIEGHKEFKPIHERLLAIYNSRERIPTPQKLGDSIYNYWQDAQSPRGLWRRTSLAEYRKASPAWETVLDLDKLSAAENEKWVFKGADCHYPEYRFCLLRLSRAGADAVVVREFDAAKKEFVKGGFELPEAKGEVAWIDANTVWVATDFGPGTMTKSGYPRVVKEWVRGKPLAEAKVLYEGKETDVAVGLEVSHERARTYARFIRAVTFFEREEFIRVPGGFRQFGVPLDARIRTANGLLFVRPRSDWKVEGATYKAGSLVTIEMDRFLDGYRGFDVLFEPAPRVSLQDYAITKDAVLLDVLDNVRGRVIEARFENGDWKRREVSLPPAVSVDVKAVDRDEGDEYWLTIMSFLEPNTLYLAKAGTDAREKLKSLPAFFDAKGLTVKQHEAASKDGTKIPYFVVMREGTKLDGRNPAILYGYGGFEISMTPWYSATAGAAWMERGGVFAVANIRGGGEFGPEWHRTAQREGRTKTHDDFIAVAEDLVARKVTSPRRLGIMGGSQGGLLVGAAFTQRPELYRAVVCQVPLLDMKRYNKLLAGASWMGEYGNPDEPKDWEFISKYSPYQNVSKEKKYPKVFFYTSTRDDRVHPGHARKMVARMNEQGHDVLYFEYMEGGHAAGTNPSQQAYTWALTYTFFLNELF